MDLALDEASCGLATGTATTTMHRVARARRPMRLTAAMVFAFRLMTPISKALATAESHYCWRCAG